MGHVPIHDREDGGNVQKEELEHVAHELDERTYRQEFQASFENLGTGIVYSPSVATTT
jgi:Ca2+-binding EF-hand superfamily protein